MSRHSFSTQIPEDSINRVDSRSLIDDSHPLAVDTECSRSCIRVGSTHSVRKKLIRGKTVAVDSTTFEADAAMKSIVRRDSGEDCRNYSIGLMRAEGVIGAAEQPTVEELRRFDKNREGKRVSNEDWK